MIDGPARAGGGRRAAAVMLIVSATLARAATVTNDAAFTLARVPVFDSDAEARVPLTVSGMNPCRDVQAILAQQTQKLAAVLDERFLVRCGAEGVPPASLQFTFTTPRVKRATSFKWEFVACTTNGDCETLGEFPFSVIPADLLKPIAEWSAGNVVYVDDAEGALAAFLDDHAIEYTETARPVGEEEQVVQLVVISAPGGRRARDAAFGERYKRIITFHDYPTELPVIRTDTDPGGVSIAVEMPMVREMAADAAHRKLFFELFQKLF